MATKKMEVKKAVTTTVTKNEAVSLFMLIQH